MRTSKGIVVFLVLSLLVTVSPIPGAEPKDVASEPQAPVGVVSNTRTASCMVKITTDPDVIWLNGDTVMHLLYSPGVVGKAAQEVLGIRLSDTHRAEDLLKIDAMRIGPASGKSRMRMEPGYEEMMRAEMEAMYRQEPMKHFAPDTAKQKKDSAERKSTDDASGSNQPSDTPPPAEGSGGMGGQGMGGFGGGMMGGQGMGGFGGGMMGGQGMGGFGGGMGGMSMMGGQGMGGSGGGMMGGQGRGGSGGGMSGMEMMGSGMEGFGGMSGMGMMGGGMGGMYGGQLAPRQTTSREQSISVEFSVHLPDDVKPAAQEFLIAVVENLRQSLRNLYEQRRRELGALADYAQLQWKGAEEQLAQVRGVRSAGTAAIEEQLNTIVDLSMLSPEMPFSEAIEELRNSVEPPLQIAVMWRELLDNADIEPSTPIDLDSLPHVQVKTALEIVLKAISGGFAELTYRIKGNVIIVGTMESFETPDTWEDAPAGAVDARALASRRAELTRGIRALELDLAGADARRSAIQEQIARTEHEAARKLKADTVTRELEKLIQMHIDSLGTVRKYVDAGRGSPAELAQANENLTKAKIELARRREELSKSAGGARLEGYNDELSRMAIDMAEKKAQFEILRRQLDEVQRQWARASQFDPATARIRMATEALHIAERRVTELKSRLANLQPPTVAMIGANY